MAGGKAGVVGRNPSPSRESEARGAKPEGVREVVEVAAIHFVRRREE